MDQKSNNPIFKEVWIITWYYFCTQPKYLTVLGRQSNMLGVY